MSVTGGPPALQAVLADAARRVGAPPRVVRMDRKEWPDGGLGCPRPGELYVQVVTPGWLIEVAGGGKVLEYHTDSSDTFVLCAER